jgi:hypothetical protein
MGMYKLFNLHKPTFNSHDSTKKLSIPAYVFILKWHGGEFFGIQVAILLA